MLNLLGQGEGLSQQLCTCFTRVNEMFPCASAECWRGRDCSHAGYPKIPHLERAGSACPAMAASTGVSEEP